MGIILRRNPDRVVAADAVFITTRSLPIRVSPEGYLETIPALAVEVRSKNDTLAQLRRKGTRYLQAGVLVVWVVDPMRRSVTEYRRGQQPHIFTETDTLTLPDLIPGFQLSVQAALQV